MNGVNDGGPAFPVICEEWPNQPGMKLRDWFAGQALAGYCSASPAEVDEDLATCAYSVADAMLEEREKGGGK
jgi:hypothetical protein